MTDTLSVTRTTAEEPPSPPVETDSETSARLTETAPSTGNRIRMLAAGFVLTVMVAMVCNAVLDLMQSPDLHRFFTYGLDEARFEFALCSLVMWVVLVGLVALTGRLFLPIGIMLAASVALGFANHEKLQLRQEPIYPSDFAFAGQGGFLQDMVGWKTLIVIGLILGLILAITLFVGRLAARAYPPIRRRREPQRWWRLLAVRIVTLGLVVAFLAYTAQFNDPGNRLRQAFQGAGAHWAFWFQKVNYERNGAVGGFLYNLNVPAMQQPADYDETSMDRIAAKYTRVATRMNKDRPDGVLDDVNIVSVLSEAFSDPTQVKGVTLAEDPIPFTRSLMRHTTSGTMLPQLFGGGTANMEFEVLTGLSLSQFLPQMNTPYQMLVTNTPTFPSAVGYFKSQGHYPLAVHPYMTSMYKRYAVYPELGFSKFVHDTTMQQRQHIDDGKFISDASAFNEVEYQVSQSSQPVFLNLVTMQNHYPMKDQYDDPIPATGVSGELEDELTGYARGLRHSDDAMRDFIGRLKASHEKTAVIFYGDHAPAFWDGKVYAENGDAAFRQTPFFIWSNYKLLSKDHDAITSPIFFLPMLMDELGARVSPFYALLLKLHQRVSAMEQGEYHLPDGRPVPESQLDARTRELLHDYRLVQYDFAVGHRYAQQAMFPQPTG